MSNWGTLRRDVFVAEIPELGSTPPPPEIPPSPTGLTATAGPAQVGLGWTASAAATSYGVSRGTASGGPYSVIATDLQATSYTDKAVTNGTRYYYVVTAANASGSSPYSNQASASPVDPAVPAAPQNLVASPGRRTMTLSWTAAPGATSYNVRRSRTSGGPYTVIASGVTATTYVNTGLQRNTRYYYVVCGVNAAGEGPNSNQASARAQ
jgi:cellulose 1,4-beta-cellobiosidase